MEKSYRKSWSTKAVYIGGGGLVIGGGIALAKGIPEGAYFIGSGIILDGLAYLHDRWEYKQYHEKNLKQYSKD